MSSTAVWSVAGLAVLLFVVVAVLLIMRRRHQEAGPGAAGPTRARDLKGRAVVALSDASRVGAVDDVLLDPSGRQVIAFRLGHRTALERHAVAAVGPDAVVIPAPDAVNEVKRLPRLATAMRLDRLRGMPVVTGDGELLGRVWDVDVDRDARHVVAYVLRGSPMALLA